MNRVYLLEPGETGWVDSFALSIESRPWPELVRVWVQKDVAVHPRRKSVLHAWQIGCDAQRALWFRQPKNSERVDLQKCSYSEDGSMVWGLLIDSECEPWRRRLPFIDNKEVLDECLKFINTFDWGEISFERLCYMTEEQGVQLEILGGFIAEQARIRKMKS